MYLPVLIVSDLGGLGPAGKVGILCWVAKHIPGPGVGTTVGGSGGEGGAVSVLSAALGQQGDLAHKGQYGPATKWLPLHFHPPDLA